MMTSRESSIRGSGTVSQRMSPLPCQHNAFIANLHPAGVEFRRTALRGGL
jgi:hypothetical protein